METIEGNKIIAAFDGWKFNEDGSVQHDRFNDHGQKTDMVENILNNYHTSFDWLMPVVEKIEGLGYTFNIQKGMCHLYSDNIPVNDIEFANKSNNNIEPKINLVWQTCVEFIQWYISN